MTILAIRSQEWRAKRDEVGGQKGRPRKSAYTAVCPTKSDKEEAECAPIKRKRG